MESLKDHTDFLDKCLAYNITVMAGSPLHAPDDRAMTNRDWLLIKNQLISDVSNLRHPAITMWNVGNELNLRTEGFICDEDPATNSTCVYSGAQVVFTVLFAFAFLGHPVGWDRAAGSAVTVFGVYLVSRAKFAERNERSIRRTATYGDSNAADAAAQPRNPSRHAPAATAAASASGASVAPV